MANSYARLFLPVFLGLWVLFGSAGRSLHAQAYRLIAGADGCPVNTRPVKSSIPGGYAIYENALHTSWADWSWNTDRHCNGLSPVGARVLAVTYVAEGAALYLHARTPVRLDRFKNLLLRVRGSGPQQSFRILINNGEPAYPVVLESEQWTQITVPLSAFGTPDSLTDLYLQEAGGKPQPAFYVEGIYLIGEPGDTPPPAEVSVAPNPVDSGQPVTVRFSGFEPDEVVETALSDMQGRIVARHTLVVAQPQVQLPLPPLPTGQYLLTLVGYRGRHVRKLLIR